MTSTQKILAGLAVIGAVVVIVIATRKEDDPKTTTTTSTTATTTETTPTTPTQNTAAPTPSDPSGKPAPIVSGQPIDIATLANEAKHVEAAREALRAGDPKKALAEIDTYEKNPNNQSLKQEVTMLKIEAMSKSGRRTDALALGMSTRDDPSFAPYRERVENVMQDAGLIGPTPPPIAP